MNARTVKEDKKLNCLGAYKNHCICVAAAPGTSADAQMWPAVPSATAQLHLLGLRRSRREENFI